MSAHSNEVQLEQKPMVYEKHGSEFLSTFTPASPWRRESWSTCPDCEAEREAERAARAAEEEARRAQREHEIRLERAQIPERFIGKTFDSYNASTAAQRRVLELVKGYAANFADHLAAGRCLLLLGGVGTGKTMLGCGILQALLSYRFPVKEGYSEHIGWKSLYTTAAEIVRTIRATWHRKADQSEAQVLDKFARPHLLVIDEVGATMGSDSEQSQLGEVIDLRYSAQLPTVVISNLPQPGLIHFLGERAVDRLRDCGGLMAVCDWPSYRGREQ